MTVKAIHRIALTCLAAVMSLSAIAQSEGTQYFMTSLPQVSISNPAFVPQYNFSIGIPGLSSVATGYYNSGFSYNNLITKTNGEVKADLPKLIKSLSDNNFITVTQNMDLLRVGFRINPTVYLQVSSTERVYGRMLIPKEAASLLVDGTAPIVGTNTQFSPTAEGVGFVETGVSAAVSPNDRITFGARLKYLSGYANVTTVSSSMALGVGSDYQITAASDLNVKTSGVHDPADDWKSLTNNTGFGADLGVNIKITERLSVAASVVDLGRITWKNNLYSYTLDKNTAVYTFSGVDLKEVVAGNNDYLESQKDAIQQKFKLQESQIGSYSTSLPTRMFASGNYELGRGLSLGGVFFAESYQQRFSPGGTVAATKHFGKWVSTTVSYTASNRSYNNFGAGVAFNVKPVQFYFVGDNLLGIPPSLISSGNLNNYINSTKVFNLRFGVNIIWGRDKRLDQQGRNSKNYGKTLDSKQQTVTSGDTKSLGNKGATKTKPTKGSPSYLKVRKKSKVGK